MAKGLEIKELSVNFNTPRGPVNVISEVSLSIAPGETVALVGESGSGKTITSLSVMRLIQYDGGYVTGGTVHLDGQDLAGMSDREIRKLRGRKVAMIFQEPMTALDPVSTIGRQISEVIIQHGLGTRSEAWTRGIELLRKVGISDPDDRMKQYPFELSGGMRQRAMIAMALACSPELLIADEPTTALDVTIQAQILQLLRELKSEFNMSILLITHDLGVAAEMADRVAVMYAGKVAELADARLLYTRPLHPYTHGLLRSITTLDSDRSKPLYSIPGSIASLSELPKGCRFNPRCPFATELCREEEPVQREFAGSLVACWHAEELLQLSLSDREDKQREGELGYETLDKAALTDKPANDEVMIEAVQVSKHYRNGSQWLPFNKDSKVIRAVDRISLQIFKGETFGLVGESGSGKSTFGRVLLQLDKATSGQVLLEGKDLVGAEPARLRDARREMQIVFQDPYGSVNPRWRVGEIIGEPLRVHTSLNVEQRREKVAELMKLVGLDPEWAIRYPHEFSGGQRQRIGIARAIALQPKFLVLDEPVSALDVSVQAQIVNLLQELQRRLGLTYLFIAHGLQVVRHLSDRVGVMYLGNIVELAPTELLFVKPAHPYTRALLSAVPSTDTARRQTYTPLNGEIPSPVHLPSGCRFHTRCPQATEHCKTTVPEWRELHAGHWISCHYPL